MCRLCHKSMWVEKKTIATTAAASNVKLIFQKGFVIPLSPPVKMSYFITKYIKWKHLHLFICIVHEVLYFNTSSKAKIIYLKTASLSHTLQ